MTALFFDFQAGTRALQFALRSSGASPVSLKRRFPTEGSHANG